MNEKKLIAIAKEEIKQWRNLPTGLPLAILWAFIYRVTRGRSVEDDFFGHEPTNSLDSACLRANKDCQPKTDWPS